MINTKQFWALFKFQTAINPFIWFMPLIFGMPLLMPLFTSSLSGDYHPGFYSLFSNQNLFFVGIFGSMVLAPEKFQFTSGNLAAGYYGSEFLLTRAIDRPVLYRAKVAVLYLLVLILPIAAVANSMTNPDLTVNESSRSIQHQCLKHVPGSVLLPDKSRRGQPYLIFIPRGNVLVAEWQLWIMLIAAMTLQLCILILYPFKYGRSTFWVLYFALIFVPLFYDLQTVGKTEPSINEHLFFSFAADRTLFWILTALAFILIQLWCERRFARLEQ